QGSVKSKIPTTESSNAERQERLQVSARLFVAADTFPDPVRIKTPLTKLLAAWKVLDDTDEGFRKAPNESAAKQIADLYNRTQVQFDENYELVRHAIETEIGEFEDANRTY